jgi:hypothetical protein
MRRGNIAGQGVFRVLAVFDLLDDGRLLGLGFGVLAEIDGRPGVEVPAIVIELAGELLEVVEGLFLELHEAEDDVDDLDARVVDVILDLDLLALEAQTAGQRVAEAGIAEMTDVGGLVRVDVGMLDDDLIFFGDERRPAGAAEDLGEDGVFVEPDVEKAAACDFRLDDALDRTEKRGGLLGDGAGGLLERLGQLEGEGQGQVAHLRVGRRGHVEVLDRDRIDALQPFVNRFFQAGFEADHVRPLIIAKSPPRASIGTLLVDLIEGRRCDNFELLFKKGRAHEKDALQRTA